MEYIALVKEHILYKSQEMKQFYRLLSNESIPVSCMQMAYLHLHLFATRGGQRVILNHCCKGICIFKKGKRLQLKIYWLNKTALICTPEISKEICCFFYWAESTIKNDHVHNCLKFPGPITHHSYHLCNAFHLQSTPQASSN